MRCSTPTWKVQLMCLVMLASSACTHVYTVPDEALEFPAVPVYELAVQLNVTPELRQTRAVFVWQGDTFITEVGEPLAANSARLARALFKRVVVHAAGDRSIEDGIEATLTPRVVSIPQSIPSSAWDQSTISMALEWSLADPTGRIVWVDTVIAVGVAAGGGGFRRAANSRARGARLVADAFEKSFDAISQSNEIARYVQSVRRLSAHREYRPRWRAQGGRRRQHGPGSSRRPPRIGRPEPIGSPRFLANRGTRGTQPMIERKTPFTPATEGSS